MTMQTDFEAAKKEASKLVASLRTTVTDGMQLAEMLYYAALLVHREASTVEERARRGLPPEPVFFVASPGDLGDAHCLA